MKLIRIIQDLRNKPIIHRDEIYFIDKKKQELVVLDKVTFKHAFQIGDKVISFHILHDHILCYGLNIYNLKGEKVFSGDAQYSFENLYYNNLSLWKLVDNENESVSYHIFDIFQKSFVKQNFTLGAIPFLFFEDRVYTRKTHIITCKNIYNGSILWQFDIAQFGAFIDKKIFADKEPEARLREINCVYYQNNKIIITLSRAIIALNPETGQLAWKIDIKEFNPYYIVFDGNFGDVGDGLYYVVIDIEKGQIVYEREFDHTLTVNIEGHNLSHILYNGLVLHNNYLWFTYGMNGKQFLLKANQHNGDILDGMLLKTKLSTYPPLFDDDRMYILDTDGVLFIYEQK
jgi:outer membrane protein assembly factor BamB